ncbi:hypothetical protein IX306_000994 [Porphyromonas levii]|nr:hypothetical protein [Porphyromonas levii]MBR8773877.1 hypothetical protein [Porphyromonas levii]
MCTFVTVKENVYVCDSERKNTSPLSKNGEYYSSNN